jgi:hypothetical protein
VAQATSFHAIDDCNGPITGHLIYDPRAPAKFGSFKKAIPAHTSHPVIGPRANVVIKQFYYHCPTTQQIQTYDNANQVKKLSAELNCLRWGSSLMKEVYLFVSKYIALHHSPEFSIPQMRFVHAALAVLDNDARDTFLVEESIDDSTGAFVKYLGNASTKPLDSLTGGAIYRAKFLVFCQHVQYIKTKGTAFIGDFQGTYGMSFRAMYIQ